MNSIFSLHIIASLDVVVLVTVIVVAVAVAVAVVIVVIFYTINRQFNIAWKDAQEKKNFECTSLNNAAAAAAAGNTLKVEGYSTPFNHL